MAIGAAKQWLVLVLWLWASPAMLVISSLRGTDALVAPSPEPGGKLMSTGNVATYLGFDERRQGHYVFVHKLNRITSTRDVTFPNNEMQFNPLPQVWDAHMYFPTDATQAMGNEYQQKVPLRSPPVQPPVAAGGQSGGDVFLDDASSADVLFHFRNSPHDEPVAFTAKMIAGPIPLPKNELEALASDNPYREQWLAASSLLGSDAVLLDYRSPPEVEAVIAALMDDAAPVDEAPVVPLSAPKVLVSRKRKG
jgi:hypothetical protein